MRCFVLTALLFFAALAAQAAEPDPLLRAALPPVLELPKEARVWEQPLIAGQVEWSGVVALTRPVEVGESGTLTLLPGTRVFVDLPAPEGHAPPPALLVKGRLLAAGTAEAPITIAATRVLDDGRADMLSIQGAKEVRLRHVKFSRGGWAVHLHETPGAEIFACDFSDLYGGLRFKSDGLTLRGNRFARNRIGVRLLESAGVRIEGNTFAGNLTGIFFRQGIRVALVQGNAFDDLEYDVKLGEGQADDVAAPGNFWKNPNRIYDAGNSEGLGTVRVERALSAPPKRELP